MVSKLKWIVGPPTSGKTEALMIDLRVARRGNRRVVAFLDPDNANGFVSSEDSLDGVHRHFVRSLIQLRTLLRDDVEVVGIEGAHRLGAGVVELCVELTGEGQTTCIPRCSPRFHLRFRTRHVCRREKGEAFDRVAAEVLAG